MVLHHLLHPMGWDGSDDAEDGLFVGFGLVCWVFGVLEDGFSLVGVLMFRLSCLLGFLLRVVFRVTSHSLPLGAGRVNNKTVGFGPSRKERWWGEEAQWWLGF